MPARPITTIALTQVALVIISFFGLAAFMKLQGYPTSHSGGWNPLALFLRQRGLWMLLVPVLWTLSCLLAERRAPRFWTDRHTLLLGLTTALAIFLLFVYAASHTGSLIFWHDYPSPMGGSE